MNTLTSLAQTEPALAEPAALTAPWTAVASVAAALALVAWAGTEPDTTAGGTQPLECRIGHPAGRAHVTTVMLVNTTRQTLPAGTVWAWAPAGGNPQRGEQHLLAQPLARGSAVRVESALPAVALRCRAALLSAPPVASLVQPAVADPAASLSAADGRLSPR